MFKAQPHIPQHKIPQIKPIKNNYETTEGTSIIYTFLSAKTQDIVKQTIQIYHQLI